MRAHARLSPSSASRYLRCPGSVNFLADFEDDGAGIPAKEGTILHAICEDACKTGKEAYDYVGEVWEYQKHVLEFTEELADYMQPGLDRIAAFDGFETVFEHRVKLHRWMPGQFGTLDVGNVGEDEVVIWDWKWGFAPVSPVENDQLRIYAMGFWDNVVRHISDAKRFRLIIEQPRAPGGGGEWVVTLDELLAFGEDVRKLAERTYDADAPRVPGKVQCEYCPGARTMLCPEYSAYNLEMVRDEFDDIDDEIVDGVPMRTRRIKSLTIEQKCFIVENRGMIDKFLDRVHADVLDEALRGNRTPGLKAALGRNPPRKWYRPDDAEARLRATLDDDAYTRKVLSPTQAEKILPPRQYQRLRSLVDHGEPKTILVSELDERPSVATLVDLFDDLSDE